MGDSDMLPAVAAVLCRAKGRLFYRIKAATMTVIPGYIQLAGFRKGTGGMKAKLQSAGLAAANGTNTVIANGKRPEGIYKIIRSEKIGASFVRKEGLQACHRSAALFGFCF